MAISPAILSRVNKIKTDLASARAELVKSNPGTLTLEDEFQGTAAQAQASEVLNGLQNMLIIWTPQIEEFYTYVSNLP